MMSPTRTTTTAAALFTALITGCGAELASEHETEGASELHLSAEFVESFPGLSEAQQAAIAEGMGQDAAALLQTIERAPAGEDLGVQHLMSAPEGFEGVATSRHGLSSDCVGIVDYLDLCWEQTTSGAYLWIEVLGVKSQRKYYGTNGMCEGGGIDAGTSFTATYTLCFFKQPLPTVIAGGELCIAGWCRSGGKLTFL